MSPGHLLAFGALFIVTLAETGRLPIDNPATHLELTMIHEAMVLEYSGRYLALIEWAAALKLLIFFSLLGNLFVPWGVSVALTPATLAVAVVSLLAKLVVLAGAVAVLETRDREAPPLPGARAAERLVRARAARGHLVVPPEVARWTASSPSSPSSARAWC